ncbi:uncharacterized protein SPSK_01611 [Sporothrix schenckii 1099-18]|uniref:Zn(2)-C6 fungal-type domain-containing protein n=1 Tax=Sporothrix schenckii 1099-18 TaxID=1397361 RepID=A0A0F2MHG5_SPOSC|nr:uncharacterized protein SPSK_01611 [Sporothrix schenckii 1099-18]KJR87611.1 hypothetical protein SPSK_01611 [Sporothrix schenckii 1099-18]
MSARKRARLACNPCRERKRKCDSNTPCTSCTQYGYECYYTATVTVPTRQRRPRAPHTASPKHLQEHVPSLDGPNLAADSTTGAVNTARSGLVQRLEGNSGAAFVRRLGLKIDPARAPKLNLFGWNLGARQLSTPFDATQPAVVLPVVEITSLEHFETLARVYFEKVHICYGFFDKRAFLERLHQRFQRQTLLTSQQPNVFDGVLAGVAALGCLFSQQMATMTELQLLHTAFHALNMHKLVGPPSIDLINGWILRTIYLRLTDSPYTVWISSCTMMHLIEASGLLADIPAFLPPREQCDPELEQRMVGVAHHLNVWTSFDLGLSRVAYLKTELSLPPSPMRDDVTTELLGLLPMSVSLDPVLSTNETDLTSTLSKLLNRQHTLGPSLMAQCNLVLCILRRIHTQNLDIPSELAEQVLILLKKGLTCARTLVTNCSPWHQVSNVPFQTVCVILVMDTRSALAMLPEAMQTLYLIASIYDTERMREACSTAHLLVRLHQQRRKDDLAVLGEALKAQNQHIWAESSARVSLQTPLQPSSSEQAQPDPSADEFSWLGALVADLPGLQRVDFEEFLNTDMIESMSLINEPWSTPGPTRSH